MPDSHIPTQCSIGWGSDRITVIRLPDGETECVIVMQGQDQVRLPWSYLTQAMVMYDRVIRDGGSSY